MVDHPLLSKSLFAAGMECPKRMWFDQHRPDLRSKPSPAEEARMREGIAVGKIAQGLYPDGVLAGYVGLTTSEAAIGTETLMDEGIPVIFEATVVAGDWVVRCDILRQADGGGWIVDEVKGSTFEEGVKKVKPEHLQDVGFQIEALRRGNVNVEGAGLVLLDKSYLWGGGEHDPNRLFTRVDVTAACAPNAAAIRADATRLAHELGAATEPDAPINTHCKKCDYAAHCLHGRPGDDLIYMIQAQRKHVDEWRTAGHVTTYDLQPSDLKHKAMLPTHRMLANGGEWVSDDLGGALATIQFPAAFIDFETCATAVPAYVGTSPHEQICFQWSAHFLDAPDAEPDHREFLHPDASDPRAEFCRTLWEAIKEAKTLVVYSSFEKTQVRRMTAAGYPFAAEILDRLENHTVDLEKIVKENVCLKGFKYRTSIKTVLPALVPTMSYADLAIGDGSAAMAAFRRMIDIATPAAEATQIRTDLLTYCGQDTLAMVEIYRALLCRAERT